MLTQPSPAQAACAEAGISIRWTIRRDTASVLEIEAASMPDPWSESNLLDALRQRNRIGMVAERGTCIVGHMAYRLRPTLINVLRFAVHPVCRRQGIGTALFAKLVDKIRCVARREEIIFDVPADCLSMQMFLRSMGTRSSDNRDDTYRFTWDK